MVFACFAEEVCKFPSFSFIKNKENSRIVLTGELFFVLQKVYYYFQNTQTKGDTLMAKVAVIYYSQTGTTHQLAEAVEAGAREAGAETRLLKVKETAPDEVWGNNPTWKQHIEETSGIREATNDDLEWADAVILGSPTRYGLPSAQLKNFLDQTGALWARGALVNKIGSSFATTATLHGGQEATILAINTVFYHYGMIIVSPGYVEASQFQSGNPYGASFTSNNGQLDPDEIARTAARLQGRRVAEITAQFLNGKK
jgi:NAD(P)H dehydrogenase (quinone)